MFGLMGVARMAGQPGGAFSPLSLFANSEQGAWYDPSDFASMFQDSTGTTPVTAVEQPVGKINDKSGNGNHATQPTAAARPVVSARVNLLRYTEDLSNGVWEDVSSGVTAKTYGQTDPLGGTTAVKLVGNNASTWFTQNIGAVQAADYTLSMWIRADAPVTLDMLFSYGVNDQVSVNVTTAWQRFSITAARAATAGLFAGLNVGNGNNIYVWHPQLEIGSTATTYQRVTTASDYDTAGFPHYLKTDGVDDFLPNTTLPYSAARTALGAVLSTDTGSSNRIFAAQAQESVYDGSGQWNYYSDDASGPATIAAGARVSAQVVGYEKPDNASANTIDGLVVADAFTPFAHVVDGYVMGASATAGGNYCAGRLYGLVVTNYLQTETQRQALARYLADKAGITL